MHQFPKSSARERYFRGPTAWLGLIVIAVLCACSATEPPLNSDLIERRFGSYGVDVLYSNGDVRRASLYSIHDGRRICRTYAIVHWRPLPDAATEPSLAAAHERIVGGASLGATLQSAGWTLEKRSRFTGQLPALTPTPAWLGLMSLENSAGLAVHIYDISVRKFTQTIEYAQIVEVHHPEHLDVADLRSLYVVRTGDALDARTLEQLYGWLVATY
jgi:hypothetical protein